MSMSTANLINKVLIHHNEFTIDNVLIHHNVVTAIPSSLIEQIGSDPETAEWFGYLKPSPLPCEQCGCEMMRLNANVKFCSNTCKDDYRKARRNATRVSRAKVPTERACEQCDEVFTGRSDARFCSSGCRVKSHRENK